MTRKLKFDLEQRLIDQLRKFEEETGIEVTDISIHRRVLEGINVGDKRTNLNFVKIKCEIL